MPLQCSATLPWDITMQSIPKLSYSVGELVVFYEDMTMATFGCDVVALEPELINQRVNMNPLCLCNLMEVSAVVIPPNCSVNIDRNISLL